MKDGQTYRAIVLLLVGVAVIGAAVWWTSSVPAENSGTDISPEFRHLARETIAAIERSEQFSGAAVQYEIQKRLDSLRIASKYSTAEQNALAIIENYRHAIRMAQITNKKKDREEVSRARQDIFRLNLTTPLEFH